MNTGAPRLDGRGWALLIALAFLWGVSFIFIKVAADAVPVFTLVFFRVGLAALVLLGIVQARRLTYPTRAAIYGRYLVMGFLNNLVPFTLIAFATTRLGAGSASILNATTPMFALIAAHLATHDEKITPAKLAGILLGIGGVAVMSGGEAVAGLGGDLVAVGAMLVATLGYGLSAVYGRRFAGIDPTVSATCQLGAATILVLPLMLLVDRPWALEMPGAAPIASLVALAVFSTALAYIIYWALLVSAGGTNTMLVTLLIPVSALFFAWLLLGEGVSLVEAGGMTLIGLGLVVIDGRVFRRIASPAGARASARDRARGG
jgi:drug/metabolite transporter (DMT)-like permease